MIHVGPVERAAEGHRASDVVLRPKEGRCDWLMYRPIGRYRRSKRIKPVTAQIRKV